ncbi:hypothetical protein QYF36_012162 [Acer negundo]|nr:hypothetical protein QYF36_012162 [Acer negundo]
MQNSSFFGTRVSLARCRNLVQHSSCSSLLVRTPGVTSRCGHGKFETLGALEISYMLFATAGGIGWHVLDLLLVPLLSPSLHTCSVPQRHSIY